MEARFFGDEEGAFFDFNSISKTRRIQYPMLPDSLAKKQRFVFKRFPVLSYKIDAVTFMSETDSQVKYTIEFFKKEPGDPRPNTTTFFIKPMRVDFKWYLTMFDSNTYNGGMTRIKN